jgi:hypothetical protein
MTKRRRIANSGALAGLAACVGCTPAPAPAGGRAAPEALPRVIVLTAEQTVAGWRDLARCDRQDTVGLAPAGTPEPRRVAVLDSAVRSELRTALGTADPDAAGRYIVQYLGVAAGAGGTALLANGFLPAEENGAGGYDPVAEVAQRYARTAPIVICDGGRVRFTMVMGTDGRVVRGLRFNPP